MDRADIIANHPLTDFVRGKGVDLRSAGANFITNRCGSKEHGKMHLCVSIDPGKQLWHCNDCDIGGSVIDWVMHEKGISAEQAMQELGGDVPNQDKPVATGRKPQSLVKPKGLPKTQSQINKAPVQDLGEPVAIYDYTNEDLQVKYQVLRYEPKTFRQRQKLPDGTWKWDLDGVERSLYNLPNLLNASNVIVVEGEKSADYLNELGLTATTNCGGSNGWLDYYAHSLRGKDVVVIPDNDPPGLKRAEKIILSLQDKANSIKKVIVPEPFKDVDQWLDSLETSERLKVLQEKIEVTNHVLPPAPIYTMKEMEQRYSEFCKKQGENGYSLQRFHPGFAKVTRKIVPGEVCLIVGDTGAMKTWVAQMIAKSAAPLPTLFFELELPETLMFERFAQMELGVEAQTIEWEYSHNTDSYYEQLKGLHHILVCPQSGLNVQQVEQYINRSALKFGKPPQIVVIDYVGLMRKANSRSRYETVSDAAEELKVIAKRCNVIMFVLSQVSRHAEHKEAKKDIKLHDAKDSGSLEASAGLVIGIWQNGEDGLTLKILKNTKGKAGHQVDVKVDWKKMRIK